MNKPPAFRKEIRIECAQGEAGTAIAHDDRGNLGPLQLDLDRPRCVADDVADQIRPRDGGDQRIGIDYAFRQRPVQTRLTVRDVASGFGQTVGEQDEAVTGLERSVRRSYVIPASTPSRAPPDGKAMAHPSRTIMGAGCPAEAYVNVRAPGSRTPKIAPARVSGAIAAAALTRTRTRSGGASSSTAAARSVSRNRTICAEAERPCPVVVTVAADGPAQGRRTG
jgi:hypothetical protein